MMAARGSLGLQLLVQDDRAEAAEWRMLAGGDIENARIRLFDRYRDLALAISRKEFARIGNLGLECSDTDQLAYEALLKAIDRYDSTRGVPFAGYAGTCIKGAIRNALPKTSEATALYSARKRIERDRLRSLKKAASKTDDSLGRLRELAVGIALGIILEEGGSAETIVDEDPSAYEAIAWQQMVGELDRKLALLPERERLVLEYHYRRDMQFTAIAQLLDLSKGRISQIHAQALGRLRKSLSKYR